MATAEIYLVKVGATGGGGAVKPVVHSVPVGHEIKTLSGSSQPTTISTPASDGYTDHVWMVRARGGAMRVIFAATPVAVDAVNGGFLLEAGEQREFGALPGQKAAVISAA